MEMVEMLALPERKIAILDAAKILKRTVDNCWLCS
jgi:hypothetical protein